VPRDVIDVAHDVLVSQEGDQLLRVVLGQQLDQGCVDILRKLNNDLKKCSTGANTQGDPIGIISADWAIVYFGQFY
jgi:hypothetical protein